MLGVLKNITPFEELFRQDFRVEGLNFLSDFLRVLKIGSDNFSLLLKRAGTRLQILVRIDLLNEKPLRIGVERPALVEDLLIHVVVLLRVGIV